MREVAAVSKGDFSNVLKTFVTTTNEDEDADTSAWKSWTQLLALEGEKATRAMIAHNTIETRPHAKLVGTDVPWPENLQFKWTEEQSFKRRKVTTGATLQGEATVTDEQASALADAVTTRAAPRTTTPDVTTRAASSASGSSSDTSKRDSAAITNLRKTHAEYDRKRREFSATLASSEAHVNTQNTVPVQLLRAKLEEATTLDANLLAYEAMFLQQHHMSADDIKSMAKVSTDLVGILKKCQKLQNNLKTWMKPLT